VLGIGTSTPRLSWIVPAADPSFVQEAYDVEVSRGGAADGGAVSDWSEAVAVEAGLLNPEDWTARSVSPAKLGGLDAPAPVLGAARR
jgi:alpha-L-rhamnosidase